MKLTCVISILLVTSIYSRSYGQTITLSAKKISIERVLLAIEKQTGYHFFYNKQEIERSGPVSINVRNASIEAALDECLRNLPLTYKIINKTIVIKARPVSKPEAVPSLKVEGLVTDEQGNVLRGVNIRVKDTAVGAVTDEKGRYAILIPDKQGILVFTHIGFKEREVPVASRAVIDVSLVREVQRLNEIVTIGYGGVRRRDLTGSVASVSMVDLEKAPVRSFEEALAGRVAGLTARVADGQPGAPVAVTIRGNNSITQDNSPLYVVDGFPMENPDNNAINPAEIESIEVLKDASSTAIYGARGANGVILITTKKGKYGKPVVVFNTYYGFQENKKKMALMSPYEFVKYIQERNPAYADSTYLTEGRDLDYFRNIKGTDLQDTLLGARPFRNYFLSLSGGSADTRYSISGSLFNQDGIIINSGYKRYQGRIRIDQKVREGLTVSVNANYSHLDQYGTSPTLDGNGFFSGSLLYNVWAFRPVPGSGIGEEDDAGLNDEDFIYTLNGFNPVKTAKNELRRKVSNIWTANGEVTYSFAKYFRLKMTGGITRTVGRSEAFNNSQTPQGSPLTKSGKDNGVSGSVLYQERLSGVNENTLSFDRKISTAHQLNVLGGFTLQGTNTSGYGAAANHIPNEALGIAGIDEGIPVSIDATSSAYTLASFLGRVNYAYRSRYLFTASLRADGSSKFAPQNKWSYFPSGAIAWQLGEEDFIRPLSFISNAKLRFSYGATGNNRVSDFAYLSRIGVPASGGYSYGDAPVPAARLEELGNRNLKWETTVQADLGLDLWLFDERVSLVADVYKKTTSNLLLDAAVPGSIGFTSVFKNIGKVANSGFELTLNTVNILNRHFSWNTNFNIAFNRNRILALSEGEDFRLTTASWNTLTSNVPLYIAAVGRPIALFYGYIWDGNYQYADFDETAPGVYSLKEGVPGYSEAIQPGFIRYRDLNGDGTVNREDATIIGDPNPGFTGGLSNNFSYRHFDLNLFVNFSYGGDVFNANRIIFEGGGYNNGQNMFTAYTDRWTPENQNNRYFRSNGAGPDNLLYSTRVVEDGSYLKLRTVQLGYRLPEKITGRMGLRSLRFYVSGQNLYTWSKYEGFDPEVSKFGNSALRPAFDYSVYPYARTITFGLNVSF
ncbi:TonB-dependent receptor [Niabella aurantiaca]|uniref:TonB-dependent receptor n=1 Tax=Niabella aurantiaca TaxID=379900 RepID=UPI00035DBE5F|nr:TonB-dependent receptor [Niabella aurantiaca]